MALKPRRWRHSPFTALIMCHAPASASDSAVRSDFRPLIRRFWGRRRVSFVKVPGVLWEAA